MAFLFACLLIPLHFSWLMKNGKIMAIIANGEIPEAALRKQIPAADTIIAADGGAEICRSLHLTPDYIVGDLDSISSEIRQVFPKTEIVQISEQETSDLEKALDFAISLSPTLIRIFGALGKRSDHALYNLLLLAERKFDSRIELYDNFGFWQILYPGTHILSGKPAETISLFALQQITGLCLNGFVYGSQNYLPITIFKSLSNTFRKSEATIRFDSGVLLFYRLLPATSSDITIKKNLASKRHPQKMYKKKVK